MRIHRDGENPYHPEAQFFEVHNLLAIDEDAYAAFLTPHLSEEEELFGVTEKPKRIVYDQQVFGQESYQTLCLMWDEIKIIFEELIKFKSFEEMKRLEVDTFNQIFAQEEKINTNRYRDLNELKKICSDNIELWKSLLMKYRPAKEQSAPFKQKSDTKTAAQVILERMKNGKV